MKLVILGAGESGVGAALLGRAKGFEVFVSDKSEIASEHKEVLEDHQIKYEEEQHSEQLILDADLVVKSPGIPDTVPLIRQLKEKQIPVIAELEFAARYSDAKFIAITGTNGKTTTTLLVYHLMRAAGFNVGLAGNVGISLARQVTEGQYDYFVVEVSSFQLDGMYEFKADIGVLLNITPDHLDRYEYNFQNYIDSKFRILQNMKGSDRFIFFADDERVRSEVEKREVLPDSYRLSLHPHAHKGARLVARELLFSLQNAEHTDFSIPVDELPVLGKHNLINAMAAISAASLAGASLEQLKEGLKTFRNAPHRLEVVADIEGVKYINDSKATNIDAAWYALESFPEKVIWIAGGSDKGNDYSNLEKIVEKSVKSLVCLGEDNTKLLNYFQGKIREVADTHSMAEAVQKASEMAEEGDIVLLSPACASFDLFRNYEDRGEQFKAEVAKLINTQE